MPANFTLTLDTLGPVLAGLESMVGNRIDGGVDVTITPHTDDADAVQIKVWGDVQGAATEADAVWQAFANDTPIAVAVTAGDGVKTVNARLRDDVWNEGNAQAVALTVDTTGPTLTITVNPDRTKISRVAGRDKSTFTWAANEDLMHYEVRVVPNAAATHDQGTAIPSAGGSTNVDGGAVAANTPVQTRIDGDDLQAAVGVDGQYVVKVFAMDVRGNWST